jgi:hypothetical protein
MYVVLDGNYKYTVKIDKLENNSNITYTGDLYRGFRDFMKGYQPRTIIVWDEKGDLVIDC